MALYFKKGSPNQAIDVPNLEDKDVALKIYGLTQQAQFGDNDTEKPSMFDVKASYKWSAWDDEKGRTQDQARQEFIELAQQMLNEREVDFTDPKKDEGDAEYQKCVEEAKAAGKTDEEIAEETRVAIERQEEEEEEDEVDEKEGDKDDKKENGSNTLQVVAAIFTVIAVFQY